MTAVFADTGYWIAVLLPGDHLHEHAMAVGAMTDEGTIVTTQMILTEVLDHLAGKGEQFRMLGVRLIGRLENDGHVEIIPQTDAQFRSAVARYGTRSDQRWSLTDCASFLAMESRNIMEALAYDRDFEQAGFVALLRRGQT